MTAEERLIKYLSWAFENLPKLRQAWSLLLHFSEEGGYRELLTYQGLLLTQRRDLATQKLTGIFLRTPIEEDFNGNRARFCLGAINEDVRIYPDREFGATRYIVVGKMEAWDSVDRMPTEVTSHAEEFLLGACDQLKALQVNSQMAVEAATAGLKLQSELCGVER